jgi:hypothetical protein
MNSGQRDPQQHETPATLFLLIHARITEEFSLNRLFIISAVCDILAGTLAIAASVSGHIPPLCGVFGVGMILFAAWFLMRANKANRNQQPPDGCNPYSDLPYDHFKKGDNE